MGEENPIDATLGPRRQQILGGISIFLLVAFNTKGWWAKSAWAGVAVCGFYFLATVQPLAVLARRVGIIFKNRVRPWRLSIGPVHKAQDEPGIGIFLVGKNRSAFAVGTRMRCDITKRRRVIDSASYEVRNWILPPRTCSPWDFSGANLPPGRYRARWYVEPHNRPIAKGLVLVDERGTTPHRETVGVRVKGWWRRWTDDEPWMAA